MLDPCPLHDADIRLMIFFVHPQVAAHFPPVTVERHTVFPGFGNIFVELKDIGPEVLQAAFDRLLLLSKILVDGAQRAGQRG
jgi:hypothetical protein